MVRRLLGIVALSAVNFAPLFSQEHESGGPPPVLQILREAVKQGKGPAHEKTEMEWVRAFRKAKFPGHYIGLDSLSGPGDAWFLEAYPSFAAAAEYREAEDKEPLKSEVESADAHDGALRESSRTMWAVYRPEMSYRPEKLNVGKTRALSIGTYRVKLGHDDDFKAGAKAILDAYQKANIDATLLCYQVIEGAPSGTYMFFSTMESLKTMDEMPARQKALMDAMGADNYRQFMKGSGDIFVSIESNLFTVNPRMSYVSKATEDADPEFWRPKPAAKPAAAEKAKEKTGQ
ncbi:MAG TPA: hypothetical protein VMT32_07960 [Bryobacteraceae bacterium]|nr:hypothetical protein [Bryobacteraceae bacterium]